MNNLNLEKPGNEQSKNFFCKGSDCLKRYVGKPQQLKFSGVFKDEFGNRYKKYKCSKCGYIIDLKIKNLKKVPEAT